MNVLLADPRGFCAGVDRAIDIVERALEIFGPPIHVRHEVVHNKYVVNHLRERGAIFIEELKDVPDGAILIFSAHGVPLSVRKEAEVRGLKIFDATCPLVTKVHLEVSRHGQEGRETILIGHAGHPEVEGTMGQYDRSKGGHIYLVEGIADAREIEVADPSNVAVVSQTTLSVDDTREIMDVLLQRFPAMQTARKSDICYATQNRQDAVRRLSERCDLILVVGSQNSSNSNRLREIAQRKGVEAYLIDGAADIQTAWLEGKEAIGITAGASAPDILVRQLLDRLRSLGAVTVQTEHGIEERVVFNLPRELRREG